MSKQGNYVALPGGSVNWAEGLSSSLANLSAGYRERAREVEKNVQLAREAADEKARYADELAFRAATAAKQDAYNASVLALDKARLDETTKHNADVLAAEAARNATLDARNAALDAHAAEVDASNTARADAAEKRAASKATEDSASALAAQNLNKFALGIAKDPGSITFTLKDYSPGMQDAFTQLTSRVEGERNAVKDFLSGKTADTKAALDVRRANLATSGLSETDINKNVMQLDYDLRGVKQELQHGNTTPIQNKARIEGILSSRYDSRLSEIQSKIAKGEGLTLEEKVVAGIAKLPASVGGRVSVDEVEAALGSAFTAPTTAALLEAEDAATAKANEVMLKNIDLYDDYIGRATENKKSYSYDAKGVYEALSKIGDLDIGINDNQRAREGLTLLLMKDHIDPEIAAAAIAVGIDKGLWGSSFPDIGSKEFAVIRQQANLLQKGKTVDSSGKVTINRDVYSYNPVKSRSVLDIQKGMLDFTPADNRPWDIKPEYSVAPAPLPNRPHTTKASYGPPIKADEKPYTSRSSLTPPSKNVTSLEALSGYSFPAVTYDEKNSNNPNGEVARLLKEELGDNIDLSFPTKSSGKDMTQREILSKDVLDAYVRVRGRYEDTRRLADNQSKGPKDKDGNQINAARHKPIMANSLKMLSNELLGLEKAKARLLNYE